MKNQQESRIMKPMKQFFTLIEILTVAAIIAILAGISVGVIGLINSKNAEAQTQATIKALELAMGQFKADNGHIFVPSGYNIASPAPVELKITKDPPSGSLNGSLFKYLDEKLLRSASVVDGTNRYFIDGWGRPLIFRIPGKFNKTGFDLGSAGPDGKVGDGGTAITHPLPSISDYSNFGKGDDITNFMRD